MVPRNVARISEYVANRPCCGSSCAPGSSQSSPPWAATPLTFGTGAPAGIDRTVPALMVCAPAGTATVPLTSEPSSCPRTPIVVSAARVTVTACLSSTVVGWVKTAPCGGASAGRWSACQASNRNIIGTANAVSLSQYWNACTNVIARMPPSATLAVTTPPTSSAPSTYGPPVTVWSVRPAPWSCGTRYSQPMNSTNTVASLRSQREPRRTSQKSGSVNAPDRRNGPATNSSRARYPAAKPTGYHSTSTPCLSTSPATPRKLAADRYSPPMAAAFHVGLTMREATRKSDVVRASRRPHAPIATVTRVTAMMAGRA